jgi:predicted Rossmann-fold nucleotide-binding protein
MNNLLRAAILAGAAVFCIAGVNSARADVLRVAIVIADSAADNTANAALLPTFASLLSKGGGKDVMTGVDAGKMAIVSTSVWANEAAVTAVTGSDAWKAEAAKLKAKSYVINIFQITP